MATTTDTNDLILFLTTKNMFHKARTAIIKDLIQAYHEDTHIGFLREIARRNGLQINSVRREVHKLKELGVLRIEERERKYYVYPGGADKIIALEILVK